MYNKDIYNHLDDKFGAFNMLLICQALSEMYKYMSEAEDNRLQKSEFEFESNWWQNAQKNVEDIINNEKTL